MTIRRLTLLLAAFATTALLACKAEVLHNLPEDEANRILSVLQDHGIFAEKVLADPEKNTWAVSVPKDTTARAWSVLEEYKLPRNQERRFSDVFGKSKLVVTPIEEQALYLEALQGELSKTVESIDGVIDARVHLVMPEKDFAGQFQGEPKGSVVVEYLPSAQGVPPIGRTEVQQIVAHAVDGMAPDSVAVILKPAAIAAPTKGKGGNLDVVKSAGLVLDRGSVQRFKVYVATVLVVLAGLGFLLLMEGRTNNRLRGQVQTLERDLRQAQRAASAAAKMAG